MNPNLKFPFVLFFTISITIILFSYLACQPTPPPETEWQVTWQGAVIKSPSYYDLAYNSGNIIATGEFFNSIDFDPGPDQVLKSYHGSVVDPASFIASFSSQGDFNWVATNGTQTSTDCTGIAINSDSINNIINIGSYTGTVNFDTESLNSSFAESGTYITKYTSHGVLLWAKAINVFATDVTVNIDDTIYLTGYYGRPSDLNPGPEEFLVNPNEEFSFFILSLTPEGEFLWAHVWESVNKGAPKTLIECDKNGSVYVTGTIEGQYDMDPSTSITTLSSNGESHLYVTKFSPNGDFAWSKILSGSAISSCSDICIDNVNEEIYIGGRLYSPDLKGSGIIEKIDFNGNKLWIKEFGKASANGVEISALAHSIDGHILAYGNYHSTLELEDGGNTWTLEGNVFNNLFLIVLDESGSINTAVQWGSYKQDQAFGIVTDENNMIYTSGIIGDDYFFNKISLGELLEDSN